MSSRRASTYRQLSVIEELFAQGHEFDFFQALRLLESIRPQYLPPGYTASVKNETVRFRSHVSFTFPPSQIYEMEQGEPQPEMMVNFMGLAGVGGVLPPFVTELIYEQERSGNDSSLRDFLDIFNHRFVSVFSRVRRMYRPGYTNDAPQNTPAARILYCILGLGMQSLRNAMLLRDYELIPFAGLIAGEPADAETVRLILSEFCGAPAVIEQFRGKWYDIDSSQHTRIGIANSQLGNDAVAGTKVWIPSAGIHVRIGKLSMQRYQALQPGGKEHDWLLDLLRFVTDDACFVDITLELNPAEVPPCRLEKGAISLGRIGWLQNSTGNSGQNYSLGFRYQP